MPAASPSAAPLFHFQGQRLGWRNRTLIAELNLSLHAGERVALLGESGSGKSTLLQQLWRQRPADIAWCPQQPGLVGALSLFHNIYMGGLDRFGTLHNLRNLVAPTQARRDEVAKLAELLEIHESLERAVDQLSGGQQQRTAVGRAFYRQKSVFVGDEPLSAVDEQQAERLLQLICNRHETVIIALHDQTLALNHFDRIIGLRGGEVVLDRPRTDVTADDLQQVYAP